MLVLTVLSEMVRDNEEAETEVELMLVWVSKEIKTVINIVVRGIRITLPRGISERGSARFSAVRPWRWAGRTRPRARAILINPQ